MVAVRSAKPLFFRPPAGPSAPSVFNPDWVPLGVRSDCNQNINSPILKF
jgi:hypothetical protein